MIYRKKKENKMLTTALTSNEINKQVRDHKAHNPALGFMDSISPQSV